MTRASLTSRDRWTLTAGIAICGSIVGVARGLPAVRAWEAAHLTAAAAAAASVAQAEEAVRLASVMTSGAARARAENAGLDSLTMAGRTPAEAGAGLSALIGRYADSARVQVVSSSIHTDTAFVRGFATARVHVTMVTDVEGTMVLLERIEGRAPLLAIRDLVAARSDPGPDGTQMLRLEMTVEALVREPDLGAGGAR